MENAALVDALVKFQRWCADGGPMLYSTIDRLEAQVAQLTLELTGCRDLIATLRNRVAEAESQRNRVREWAEAYANTIRKRMAADRCRGDHGAYVANETVLADLDTLAAQPTEASDGK